MRGPLLLAVTVAAVAAKAQAQAHALGGLLRSDPGSGAQKPLFESGSGVGGGIPGNVEIDAVKIPASCTACEAALLQLKLAAARGDDFFVALTTGAYDDVCEGSLALEGPILAHSLRGLHIGSKTSRLLCIAHLGMCSFPDVEEYKVSFPSPKPKGRRPKPSGKSPLRIVHYSDIQDYSDRLASDHVVRPARPNGEHTCDSPVALERSMYEAIQRLVPDTAFAIFTGDIVDHAIWNTTIIQNTLDVTDAYDRMATAGFLVYGTAGNHEASPTNSYPPLAVSSSTQWLYDVLSSSWTKWVEPRAVDTVREFGGYSTKYPDGNLRVISLSTNLYYVHNYWLYEEPMEKDPSGQLAWLIGELDAAEKAGERVYIIGHMSLGARDAFHDVSNHLDQIVNRYEATIAGLFFGHTHFDEFEISYSNYSQQTADNAVAVSYVGPSMTPTSGHPAFRVYDIDPVTFGVLDITTYIANMSDPAFQGAEGPVWTKYYSAREAYGELVNPPLAPLGIKSNEGIRELDPAFWHEVTEIFEEDPAAFEKFMTRKRRGWQPDMCDDDCRSAEICQLRAGRAQDNCMLPRLIRSENGLAEDIPTAKLGGQECGGSVLADTLGTLAGDAEMRAWLEQLVDDGDREL
ncbi:hypothetical protein E0Z10_g2998 [Xylaria hypoxylon]|uniref:Calcineurin-like phosphoesterase domain-containing protein n=1 Tax=Xylaria hypoxylon TaxID=37992 RepID=A0A4Z0Z0R0_9PEZI|nr:hypothetical protein E0Z10_g2998 [Xylaria hypoxylon]